MIYLAVFNKLSTKTWEDRIDAKAALKSGAGFNSLTELFKALILNMSHWLTLKEDNIIYVGAFEQKTGKLQSITKYKFDIDFKFLKQEEITTTPINPQLKQLFMKNFEEVDRYE